MQDLLLDDTDDLLIENGDFVIGISDLQHQEHLLIAQKGDFKQFPDIGVAIEDYLRESDIEGLVTEVRNEFVKDGMAVNRVEFLEQTGDLDYDAKYPI